MFVDLNHFTEEKGFTVVKGNILSILKQTFEHVIPAEDKRTKLSPIKFVSGFVFCFIGDTKTSSLEAIRRFLIYTFNTPYSKGAFWERLSGNTLKNMLHDVLADLIKKVPSVAMVGKDILAKLDVISILLIDSSSITLWDGAKKSYPGSRTTAGIKWHACFDLLSGKAEWFSLSPTSVHDRKHFPDVAELKRKLIICDLGYWDFDLFHAINLAGGFFLSRVKSNAVITIEKITKGLGEQFIDKKLSSIPRKKRRGKLIELVGKIGSGKNPKSYRVIGFWNLTDKKYHWYVTNLKVSASVIYTLYRIRWQIELIFKGCKRSLNLDGKMTSNNENIIESLVLSSLIASFAMHVVLSEGKQWLSKQKRLSISFQRLAIISALLAQDFIKFLTLKGHFEKLRDKIKLFSSEMFEKNHNHRSTTLQKLANELAEG